MDLKKFGSWEPIAPLGEGGQSEVRLVRRPERTAVREEFLKTLKYLSGQGFNDKTAESFAIASAEIARADTPGELAAQKIFNKIRDRGAPADLRLQSEIDVLKKNKPGLPRLLDANVSEKWIVTEYFVNKTVEHAIGKFKGEPVGALRAFRSLVATVAFSLHADEIVHRDIKPANVFLGDDGNLVPGDFGIVYLPGIERLTMTEERVGPWDYMPQWADLGIRYENVKPNFDVYMLGKLLWCMVAGRLRLPREYHRLPEFDVERAFPDTKHIGLINPILDRCLVERPGDCLPTAKELLAVIDENLAAVDRGAAVFVRDGKLKFLYRICGKGSYHDTTPPSFVHLTRFDDANRNVNAIRLRVLMCSICGHQEFFAPEYPEKAARNGWTTIS